MQYNSIFLWVLVSTIPSIKPGDWDGNFVRDKTFTDYIDDVSGKYIVSQNYDVNLANPYQKYLSNQSQFVPGITKQELGNYGTGSPRGNPKNNDSFVTTAINFGIMINPKISKRMRQQFFRKKQYKSRASF